MPLLILTALIAVYIVLGMLYESLIHPLTIPFYAALGRAWGVCSAMLVTGNELSICLDHRNHPAHRHREKERDHDGRFRARRRAPRGTHAGRIDLPGVPGPVSSHHDDNDGRDVWRVAAGHRDGYRQRTAQSRSVLPSLGAYRFADAHALHDSRDLFGARSTAAAEKKRTSHAADLRTIGWPQASGSSA